MADTRARERRDAQDRIFEIYRDQIFRLAKPGAERFAAAARIAEQVLDVPGKQGFGRYQHFVRENVAEVIDSGGSLVYAHIQKWKEDIAAIE